MDDFNLISKNLDNGIRQVEIYLRPKLDRIARNLNRSLEFIKEKE